jgi:hypothetical protein
MPAVSPFERARVVTEIGRAPVTVFDSLGQMQEAKRTVLRYVVTRGDSRSEQIHEVHPKVVFTGALIPNFLLQFEVIWERAAAGLEAHSLNKSYPLARMV